MINAIVLAAGESRRMGMPKALLRFPRSMGVPPMSSIRLRRIPAVSTTGILPVAMQGQDAPETHGRDAHATHGQDARATKSPDTTFLEQIVGVLRRCDLGGITVVLGAQAETVRTSVDLSGVDVVINEKYRDGQLSSLIAGLRHRGEGIGTPNAIDRVWEPGPPLRPAGILPARRERGQPRTEGPLRVRLTTADAILLCLVDNPFLTTDVAGRIIDAFQETRKLIVVPVFQGRRGHPALFARPVFDELLDAPPNEGARCVVNANQARVFEVDVPDGDILTKIDTPEDYRSRFGVPPRIGCEER